MRTTTKFLLTVLAIEAAVIGFAYFQKNNQPTPAVPNLATVDSLTREGFEAAIAKCTSPKDWHNLANMYMAHGFYPEANATFARACELDSKSKELAYDYAFCLARSGDVAESNVQFERALALGTPKKQQAHYFIGRNYLRAEDSASAEKYFRMASELAIAKYELAKILYRQDKLEEAEDWIKKCLVDEPDTPQALSLLSNIRMKRGDRKEALGDSIESIINWARIPTPFADERTRLMNSHAEVGYSKELQTLASKANGFEHEFARKGLRKLQDLEWNLTVQENLIKCAKQGRRLHVAIDLTKERLDRFGPSSNWYSRLGQTYLMLGEKQNAVDAWLIGAELNSDEFGKNCYRNLARYYIEDERDIETSKKYQARCIIGFAKEGLSHGKYDEASGFAKTATQLAPNSAEAFYVYGQTLVGLGRMDAATEAFLTAKKLDPTHGRTLMHLEALGID